MFDRLLTAIAKRVDERRKLSDLPEVPIRNMTAMERMFGDCSPAIVAFKIDNGYVVRSISMSPQHESGGYANGFTYCKDHQAIADYIVSEAVREKVLPGLMKGAISNVQVTSSPSAYSVPKPRY